MDHYITKTIASGAESGKSDASREAAHAAVACNASQPGGFGRVETIFDRLFTITAARSSSA